jgi:hypothetical protein
VRSGGGSDGNLTAALGIPTLDGLGAVDGHPHARSEHPDITGMPQRAALLAARITRIRRQLQPREGGKLRQQVRRRPTGDPAATELILRACG